MGRSDRSQRITRRQSEKNEDVPPPYEPEETSSSNTPIQEQSEMVTVDCPPYTPAESSSVTTEILIATPQTRTDPTAPFLNAYSQSLLSYGITSGTWSELLTRLSTLLSTSSSQQAASHVGDVAGRVAEGPSQLGKDIASHAKSVGKNIADNAKRGNVLGAALGTIGGGIGIISHATFGAVGTILSLPSASVASAAQKPQTRRQRVDAAVEKVNIEYFQRRGLKAQVVDSSELGRLMGVDGMRVLESVSDKKAAETVRLPIPRIEGSAAANLALDERTLWLIVSKQSQMANDSK